MLMMTQTLSSLTSDFAKMNKNEGYTAQIFQHYKALAKCVVAISHIINFDHLE